ncbi:MAG TPA: Holliday junction branch migration protein RuvA [Candidatus Saccharimonadales bacterium]|nr:Holliday junction branch migration protein RuvA [Candidatus Saccharimonadales bacterium]
MIAYLEGVIREKNIDSVVIDVNGVGYGVKVTLNDIVNLKGNEKVKLHIYENIREDMHDLYGFVDASSRRLFELLLTAKNVGPKVALAVMSIDKEEAIRSAIAGGDVELIKSAKHVGKRAAEQIVVELRDKVGLQAGEDAEGVVTRGSANTKDEAVQALISLGFSSSEASVALSDVDKTLPTEEKVKLALRTKR